MDRPIRAIDADEKPLQVFLGRSVSRPYELMKPSREAAIVSTLRFSHNGMVRMTTDRARALTRPSPMTIPTHRGNEEEDHPASGAAPQMKR